MAWTGMLRGGCRVPVQAAVLRPARKGEQMSTLPGRQVSIALKDLKVSRQLSVLILIPPLLDQIFVGHERS